MPVFIYEGFNEAGERIGSEIEADDKKQAILLLRKQKILISSIAERHAGIDWREIVGLPASRLTLDDLGFLTTELSLLLGSGVRVDRALSILQRSRKAPAISHLLSGLAGALKQGMQLSQALATRPEIFPPLYINLVSLGEAGGLLPEVFERLAEDLRFQRDLKQKVISAAIYPLVVASVCVMSLIFIFNFVVPNLEVLFADRDDLPWYTALLMNTSDFMRDWQWFVLGGGFSGGLLVWRSRASPMISRLKDEIMLEWRVLRQATAMVERIRFSSGLAMMLGAGLPVDKALTLAAENIRHGMLRREVSVAVERVKRGEQISTAMRQTRIFPDYFASIIEIGEESGELAKVFSEIAERSRNEFSSWALRLTSLLEPALILVMGLIVGGVVVVMMLSITSVADVGL